MLNFKTNHKQAALKELICHADAILIGAGAGAAVGQFGITAAYKYAPAREISIYDYTLVIFAAIWSFIFFGELPDWISIIGYVLIFGMSALMFLYNNRHAESAK